MKRFALVTSILAAVSAIAILVLCMFIPKLEWMIASLLLAVFSFVQYRNIRKLDMAHQQKQNA